MLQKLIQKKKVWCGIIAVQLLLLFVSGVCYDRRERVELDFAQEALVDDTGAAGFYIDQSYGLKYVATPDLTLPRGMYTVELWYEYKGDVRLEICYPDNWFDSDIGGNIIVLDSGHVQSDFRIKYNDRPFHVQGRLSGEAGAEDYLLLRNVRITTADMGTRNFVFRLAVLCIVLDLLLMLYVHRERLFGDAATRNIYKLLLLLVCLSSLPLTVNYLFANAQDLGFHLSRIEGIRDGLQNGVFPVKIHTNWLNGYGYAVSVFYGDVLLYIPVLLRMFGVSVLAAYNFYVFMVNVLTVGISYSCFTKMSNRHTGLLCAALYTLNIFRLYDVYARAAVGEYTAMAFMPLVLYGLWCIYKQPEGSKEQGRGWLPLSFGCSGIFLSHMISTEMTALFVLMTVVILWKRTIRPKTFAVLLRTLAATVLLNLWFLLPFLDYMASGRFVINSLDNYVPYRMEEKGGFLVQLFMTEYEAMGASGAITTRGAASNMPHTAGNALMLILIGWFMLCVGQKERSQEERKEEYLAVFLGVLGILMTRCLFPYTWLVGKLPFLRFPVHGLQFQWRFFTVTVVILIWLLCILMRKEWIDRKKKVFLAGLLVVVSVSQSVSYISKLMNEAGVVHIYQAAGVDLTDIGFEEYIPVGENGEYGQYRAADCREELRYDASALNVTNWYREKGTFVLQVENISAQSQTVEVPILLYKGYRAVTDSGEQLQIMPGSNYRIAVSVPAGYAGGIRVRFYEPWYWRVCEAISAMAWLAVIGYLFARPNPGSRGEFIFYKKKKRTKSQISVDS